MIYCFQLFWNKCFKILLHAHIRNYAEEDCVMWGFCIAKKLFSTCYCCSNVKGQSMNIFTHNWWAVVDWAVGWFWLLKYLISLRRILHVIYNSINRFCLLDRDILSVWEIAWTPHITKYNKKNLPDGSSWPER